MVYRGHVENGVIRLDGAIILPEGLEVRVEVGASENSLAQPQPPTVEDLLRAIVADVSAEEWERLPADLTDHLDHYAYRTSK
jgi:hypothetical protein